MPIIDTKSQEIQCKIVYYGPPGSGKTSSLQYLYNTSSDLQRSDLLFDSLRNERIIFFSFVPFNQMIVSGFLIRFYLYTIPGNVQYNETLIDLLNGVDGVVFVADSQKKKLKDNKQSIHTFVDNIRRNTHLISHNRTINNIPIVMQLNKRDLSNIIPIPELDRSINRLKWPIFETIATQGVGVSETLNAVCQRIIEQI